MLCLPLSVTEGPVDDRRSSRLVGKLVMTSPWGELAGGLRCSPRCAFTWPRPRGPSQPPTICIWTTGLSPRANITTFATTEVRGHRATHPSQSPLYKLTNWDVFSADSLYNSKKHKEGGTRHLIYLRRMALNWQYACKKYIWYITTY